MGDRAISEVSRQAITPANEAGNHLRDDAYASYKSPDSHRSQWHAGNTKETIDNPVDHLAAARAALKELKSLNDQPDEGTVLIRAENDELQEIPVPVYKLALLQLADEQFVLAIKAADQLSPRQIERLAAALQKQIDQTAVPQEKEQLQERKDDEIETLNQAAGVTRIAYAKFLAKAGEFAPALQMLEQAAAKDVAVKNDPGLKKLREQLTEALRASGEGEKAAVSTEKVEKGEQERGKRGEREKGRNQEHFDDPRVHLTNAQKLAEKEDMKGVRDELEAAIKAADGMDRKLMHENKLDHAATFARIELARLELASKNYEAAKDLLNWAESHDKSFTKRPELRFALLREAAEEPSTWQKIWDTTKSVSKELLCDGVAVAAGAGTALLTGWSGPGAVVAGGVAGGAAYTAMKGIVGVTEAKYDGKSWGESFENGVDQLHWYTPLWGVVDGVSGGTAGIARTALTRAGGKILAKEVAEKVTKKAGVELAALTTRGGELYSVGGKVVSKNIAISKPAVGVFKPGTLEYGKAVRRLCKEGLGEIAAKENMGFWSKAASHIPFTKFGDAAYRHGLNGLREITWRNVGARGLVDGGTVLAGSAVYRGCHDTWDYNNGKYSSFGDLASNYGRHVVSDTTRAVGIGAYSTHFGYGALTSFGLNGARQYFSGNDKTFRGWADNSLLGTGEDMLFSTPLVLGGNSLLGQAAEQVATAKKWSALGSAYMSASPYLYEQRQKAGSAEQIGQELAKHRRKPANNDEWQRNYFALPGTDQLPSEETDE